MCLFAEFHVLMIHFQKPMQEAAAVLEALIEETPRDAAVHYLLGRVYKRQGLIEKALVSLSLALDLDPKNSQFIRVTIDRIEAPEDPNEEVIELV
jgi:anaphase-promoting complex subunit 3